MATPDQLGEVPGTELPPGTEMVDANDMEVPHEGLITEPVLGMRMLMSSRVSF